MPDGNQTVAFVSLGCPKNLVDSEKMLGQLAMAGMIVTGEEEADVIVVNTCGFLEAARDESLAVIRDVVRRKQDGPCRRVVVAGCLAQRMGETLFDEVPGIDAVVGVNNRDDIVAAAAPDRPGATVCYLDASPSHMVADDARLRLTPRHYAYLRISEGCDQQCTFCAIPSIRGPLRSKPIDLLLAEARELIDDGAVELVLIGQETTSYGHDLGAGLRLADALRRLDGLDGVRWIRLMYAYPVGLDEAAIDAIAECQRVVKYIDLPLQHVNDRLLKAMHRRIDRAGTERLLARIRGRIPGVTLRTTLLAGFPGETEDEFVELLGFVRDFAFDMLGVFPYSQEPGTPASRMRGGLPDDVIGERVEALMLAQQEIAFAKADAMAGRTVEVLVDGPAETPDRQIARHAGQAPEVDSVTVVTDCANGPGEFVSVRVRGREDYDLVAEPDETT